MSNNDALFIYGMRIWTYKFKYPNDGIYLMEISICGFSLLYIHYRIYIYSIRCYMFKLLIIIYFAAMELTNSEKCTFTKELMFDYMYWNMQCYSIKCECFP